MRRLVNLAVAAALAGCGGADTTADLPRSTARLHLSSPAFIDGSRLPQRYTCDGAGDEPDGISPRGQGSVSEGGSEGRNSAGKVGWTPPCPPKGDGPHRYVWSVYALRNASDLRAGAAPDEVVKAVGHGVLASGAITAKYGR